MRNWIGYMLVAALSAGVLGCGSQVQGKAPDPTAVSSSDNVLIPIHADYPGRSDIAAYFETTSRIQAERRVEVISKGLGLCLKVMAEEGDKVKAGEVLAELDKEELQAQLRQTLVSVEQHKTAYQIAEQSLEKGIGSRAERDNTRFIYEQAQATLNLQQVQLRHQTITAPISGIVTMRHIQPGMLVSAGMPAFSIVDPTSYVLPINPPEKELSRLQIGQEARVTIDSKEGQEFVAYVRRINPSVDPMSGTVKVMLDFNEADRESLREAAFARVRLVMETHENALVVPKDAILEENARKYLMTVREQAQEAAEGEASPGQPVLVAERIEVQTGLEDSNTVEILSGIDDTTRFVTLGQHTLKPGSMVSITNARDEILPDASPAAGESGMSPEASG